MEVCYLLDGCLAPISQEPLWFGNLRLEPAPPDPQTQEESKGVRLWSAGGGNETVHCSDTVLYNFLFLMLQQTLLICLVPELCQMTGLLDSDRSDFRVMKVS